MVIGRIGRCGMVVVLHAGVVTRQDKDTVPTQLRLTAEPHVQD